MKYEMKAVYRDRDGSQFSYPLVKTPSGWKLSGLVDVVFYLREPTAVGGLIEFVDYVLEAPPGIRGCDYIQINNAWRVQLPWPQKPAEPPTNNQHQRRSTSRRTRIKLRIAQASIFRPTDFATTTSP
jgi:hypothetical protein